MEIRLIITLIVIMCLVLMIGMFNRNYNLKKDRIKLSQKYS